MKNKSKNPFRKVSVAILCGIVLGLFFVPNGCEKLRNLNLDEIIDGIKTAECNCKNSLFGNGDRLIYDYLSIGFDKQVQDSAIENYINQMSLFNPVSSSEIIRSTSNEYNFLFLNSTEQKTCLQLKQIICELERSPLVAFANFTFELVGTVWIHNILTPSDVVHVMVKDTNDLSDLYVVAQETNTRFKGRSTYGPDWFSISTDKNSMGKAMEMANYFYETEKFIHTASGSLGTWVNR